MSAPPGPSGPVPPALPGPLPSAGWRQRATDACAALGIDAPRLARRAVIGAALLTVAVVGLLAWRGSGGTAPPELSLPRAGSPAEPTASTSAPTPEIAYAHAAGAVTRPGLYRVPPGARVSDLLDAAGGPAADADIDQLNLAAPVADGERVYVPRKGEAPPAATAGNGGAATATATPTGPVNLNTATLEQLDALPGVGPATAQAILDYRAQHGRFRSVEELLEVRGIGDAKLADLRPRVRV